MKHKMNMKDMIETQDKSGITGFHQIAFGERFQNVLDL